MKVMLVLTTFSYVRYILSVVAELINAGSEVIIVTNVRESEREVGLTEKLSEYIAQGKLEIVTETLLKKNVLKPRLAYRNLAGYINYFRSNHLSPSMSKRMFANTMIPNYLKTIFSSRMARKLFSYKVFRDWYKSIEGWFSPDLAVQDWLKKIKPDVVVATGYVFFDCWDVEYVKAAKALGVSTAAIILSWDNLLIKGSFTLIPDAVLLWNKSLSREAREIHDVPARNIKITGAPVFDYLFDLAPSKEKSSFQEALGMPPEARYVLYLGSSAGINQDETGDVLGLIDALQSNPLTREVYLLIRPHPFNNKVWSEFSAKNVCVWSSEVTMPVSDQARLAFYHSIFYSECVFGVNTSAMLEAAILDKPCITVMASHGRSDVVGIGHFHHLLDSNFLYVAGDFQEASRQLISILQGGDVNSKNRQRFVQEFVRPEGVNTRSGVLTARAIESLAHVTARS